MATKETGIGPYAIFAALGVAGGTYLWYRSKKITPKPPLVASSSKTTTSTKTTPKSSTSARTFVDTPMGKMAVKPLLLPGVSAAIMEVLTDREKLRTGTKSNTTKFPNSDVSVEQVFRGVSMASKLAGKIKLDFDHSPGGLLGRLVASYYSFERGRAL